MKANSVSLDHGVRGHPAKNSTAAKLAGIVSRRWLSYVGLFVVMALGIGLDLGLAWYMMQITDTAVLKEKKAFIDLIVIGLCILLLSVTVNFFDSYLKSKVSNTLRNDLRIMTFHHMLRLPSSYFDKSHSGELLTRLTSDNQAIGQALGNTLMMLIRSPVMAVFSFIYLLSIYWPLAVVCGFIGPLTLLVGKVFGKALRENGKNVQDLVGKSTGFLQDVLSGNAVVKAFQLEQKFYGKYKAYSGRILARETKAGTLNATMQAASNGIGVSSFIIAFVLGAYFVINGKMTIGALIAFIQLLNHVTWPFTGLAGLWGSLQNALGSADRIFEVLEQRVEHTRLPESAANKEDERFVTLELDGLGFGYDDGKKMIENLSFTVEAGQMIALVGPSGAGKTTLFKLLLGLYRPTSGQIRLNGQATASMGLDRLRGFFSLVPQETYLFSGTFRENIADGRADATDEEILAAAKHAHAYDFIMKLPEGLDTEIGERGVKLSGGQKQRIAIARALLRNAPVLLLDEATAALDNKSEHLIQSALEKLMTGRTTFVIAHRLSTVQRADRILVMDNGQLAESGTHDELLAAKGLYSRLYHMQFKTQAEELG
ncbi:ABC transporter ATP-binding protein [Paenibacillus contaminans]|uniref:ABC transporter ATP-binding protein n=1 Tax=Paenibacillus contaminans TaxID=450362 RepID=A0A329M6K3_9BACL|nr:ABC transporter ATP-binding protein [Paenibacillus contaminans]RAV12617.1 ABC transporter ATP-binding protein [Paenibacillus contaminans]